MSPFLYPPPNNAPVVIYEDGGGLVDKYMEQAYKYSLEGRRVEIRGSCRSACLLALSVPNVCITPEAVVKTHHAYEERTGVVREDMTNKMLAELPAKIRSELEGKIQKNYTAESTLDYAKLRRLNVPDCSSQRAVAKDKPARTIPVKLMNPFAGLFRIFTGAR